MTTYRYKFVPAPQRGIKTKGAKDNEARFAAALDAAVNELAAEGWEYLRTDTLPSDERKGLTGRETIMRTLLVFRRPTGAARPTVEADEDTAEPFVLNKLASPAAAAAGTSVPVPMPRSERPALRAERRAAQPDDED